MGGGRGHGKNHSAGVSCTGTQSYRGPNCMWGGRCSKERLPVAQEQEGFLHGVVDGDNC